jgi:hypothetical protein
MATNIAVFHVNFAGTFFDARSDDLPCGIGEVAGCATGANFTRTGISRIKKFESSVMRRFKNVYRALNGSFHNILIEFHR